MQVVDLETLVGRLAGGPGRSESLTHLEVVEARPARETDWPTWLHGPVREAFERVGVPTPWTHQAAAAQLAQQGQHTVISTGTASGKSLAYLLPALHAIETARGPKGQRGASVLYLAPTKALAQDQLATLRRLSRAALPDLRCSTHDGDSTPEMREWTRDHGEYVLTNPDMLHHSLLPGHARWSRFFGSLRYVVVDECHHYRGVFGAHVAQILRRLRRVAALHGAHPTFILASATVAEPEMSSGRLTGLEVSAVTDDGSPRGRTALALWEPPFVPGLGENGAPVRRSATSEVA
ncbi:MAG: box helicase protein, partial [Nocardioidaceae bacterium]|nr:box helicase protein [Nocardioidaceae bacterium]